MATIATHNGGSRANRDHNRRNPKVVAKEKHIDPNGHYEIWKDVSPRKAYNYLFGDYVKEFNARQRHLDRRIKDYYGEMCKDGKKHAVYEMIISVGNRDNPIDAETGKKIMHEFVYGDNNGMKAWRERNPHLTMIGAYYHADEQGVPHVHIDYIPVATNCTRGMKRQNSLSRALQQQGFWTSSKHQTAQICWERSENAHLEQLCNNHGIAVEHPDIEGREHLETEVYQLREDVKRLNATIERLQEQYEEAKADNDYLLEENLTYMKCLDKFRDEQEEVEKATEGFKEHIKSLKAEISTLEEEKRHQMDILEALKQKIENTVATGVSKGFTRESLTNLISRKQEENRFDKFLELMGQKQLYEKYCESPKSFYAEVNRMLKKSRDNRGDHPDSP